jgi:hypothetical protein
MRIYNVLFENVTVSAPQDLCLVTGATGKIIFVIEMWVGCTNTTLATGQGLQLRARFLPATVTAGTGGATAQTPTKVDPGDATCSTATCGMNNTTPATTSGTAIKLYENGCHLYQGDRYRFPVDERPVVGPSEAFVWELLSTVSGAVAMSGGVKIGEVGG